MLLGGAEVGAALVAHEAVPLVSATGSTAMGRRVAPVVAGRFARSILELGGNNAAIIAPSADLDLALRGIVFAAVGTAGQRCTSLRRLIVHRSIHDQLVERIGRAYASLPIGDPLADGTLVGPLIDAASYDRMQAALATAGDDGGKVVAGGERALADEAAEAYYARPAIVAMPAQTDIVRTETFAPILYALAYDDLDEAVALHNGVPQGLASSIFTTDLREAERFMGPAGSDCGIANVNIGPSGAEIGGAFGGEKETGGGRESGIRRLEGLHAPGDEHRELLERPPPRPRRRIRHRHLTTPRELSAPPEASAHLRQTEPITPRELSAPSEASAHLRQTEPITLAVGHTGVGEIDMTLPLDPPIKPMLAKLARGSRPATGGCTSRSGMASGASCSATATTSSSPAATRSRSTVTSPSSSSRSSSDCPTGASSTVRSWCPTAMAAA